MLDAPIRRCIDPALNAAGRRLAAWGMRANTVTILGLVAGLASAAAVSRQHYLLALGLMGLSRLLDGLDGPIARAGGPSDQGGYLDIVCDYAFYAAVPFGFAWADPARNALAAAGLLGSFTLTGATFLAYAAIAEKRGGLPGTPKAFYYSFGLMEGTETIAFLAAMVIFPLNFPALAWIFSGLCVLTALQRSISALAAFG